MYIHAFFSVPTKPVFYSSTDTFVVLNFFGRFVTLSKPFSSKICLLSWAVVSSKSLSKFMRLFIIFTYVSLISLILSFGNTLRVSPVTWIFKTTSSLRPWLSEWCGLFWINLYNCSMFCMGLLISDFFFKEFFFRSNFLFLSYSISVIYLLNSIFLMKSF